MEAQIDKWEGVSYYSELFKAVNAKVGDAEIALAILHELGKDRRAAMIQAERSRVNGNGFGPGNGERAGMGDLPATSKQLGLLRSLGVEAPAGLTKKAASALIDEALAQRDG